MTRAISYVRPIEGGRVDHPDDPGGITTMGISLRHAIAIKLYDYHFPTGLAGAGLIVQRALNALGKAVPEK